MIRAMKYHFYTTSEKAWGAMLAEIARAEKSIFLEMYIFNGDTERFDFLTELIRKAEDGVRVFIILDALGSSELSQIHIDRLRGAGCEVLFFSYWFRRTHRKILIVDERIAFIGGVNIAKRFARWNDLHVRVGGGIVREITRSFIRVYHECGGKDPLLTRKSRIPKLALRAKLWFLEHGIKGRRNALRRHYEEYIHGAEHAVTLITPYLVPRHWLISAIHGALLRGVKVRILIPRETDSQLIDRINRFYLSRFSALGAQCKMSEIMNHAKVMIIDEKVATIGSQNLDAQSFDWNVESGIFFDDPKMVGDLIMIVSGWWEKAIPENGQGSGLRWYDALLSVFLKFFARVL